MYADFHLHTVHFSFHGQLDEALGEVAVAHEERAVEVGAEHVLIDGAFAAIFTVVAVAADDGAEGTLAFAEEGPAIVVLKAEIGFTKFVVANLDVADETGEVFLMQGGMDWFGNNILDSLKESE